MRVDAPVLVREATLADAAEIGEIHAEAWRLAYRDLFESRWLSQFAESRRAMWPRVMTDPEFAKSTVLVAQRGTRVVAFAGFGRHRDNVNDGELHALYAHPSVWGTGVAQTLLDGVWDSPVTESYRRLRLWTIAGANRARRFYTSAGFTETGLIRERDYGDGRPVLEIEYARRAGG
ncbi:GNAT family N-acetyltransferase [Actinokineospora sp.]|uniref:GNAT family N-acetyltransferase n=1 Tax=Actinokineospora sp. TaxID=1872133 RepID=UPI0040376CAE